MLYNGRTIVSISGVNGVWVIDTEDPICSEDCQLNVTSFTVSPQVGEALFEEHIRQMEAERSEVTLEEEFCECCGQPI